MATKIKNIMMMVAMLAWGMLFTAPVYADGSCTGGVTGPCNPICSSSADAEQKAAAGCNTTSTDTVGNHVTNIINAAISVIGLIGVFVIVMAGQRLMTAAGDPGKIKQAKDMILWAVVGIIIAVLAWAIITFVLGALPTASTTTTTTTSTTTTTP